MQVKSRSKALGDISKLLEELAELKKLHYSQTEEPVFAEHVERWQKNCSLVLASLLDRGELKDSLAKLDRVNEWIFDTATQSRRRSPQFEACDAHLNALMKTVQRYYEDHEAPRERISLESTQVWASMAAVGGFGLAFLRFVLKLP